MKVHLASKTSEHDPLDLFFDGSFAEWQARQTRQNFKRKYILGLIKYPGDCLWLFAGVWRSNGIKYKDEKGIYHYETKKNCRLARIWLED